MSVIDKVNSRQKSLHRQNYFLTAPLRIILRYVLIQSHFDYASTACFSNLLKRHTMRFFLQLDKKSKPHAKEFLQ